MQICDHVFLILSYFSYRDNFKKNGVGLRACSITHLCMPYFFFHTTANFIALTHLLIFTAISYLLHIF